MAQMAMTIFIDWHRLSEQGADQFQTNVWTTICGAFRWITGCCGANNVNNLQYWWHWTPYVCCVSGRYNYRNHWYSLLAGLNWSVRRSCDRSHVFNIIDDSITPYVLFCVILWMARGRSCWPYRTNNNNIIIINTVFVYAISLAIKPFRGASHFTWTCRLPSN